MHLHQRRGDREAGYTGVHASRGCRRPRLTMGRRPDSLGSQRTCAYPSRPSRSRCHASTCNTHAETSTRSATVRGRRVRWAARRYACEGQKEGRRQAGAVRGGHGPPRVVAEEEDAIAVRRRFSRIKASLAQPPILPRHASVCARVCVCACGTGARLSYAQQRAHDAVEHPADERTHGVGRSQVEGRRRARGGGATRALPRPWHL
jgi:hypothetical protein